MPTLEQQSHIPTSPSLPSSRSRPLPIPRHPLLPFSFASTPSHSPPSLPYSQSQIENISHIDAMAKSASLARRNSIVKNVIIFIMIVGGFVVFGGIYSMFSLTQKSIKASNTSANTIEEENGRADRLKTREAKKKKGHKHGLHRITSYKQNGSDQQSQQQQKIIHKIFNPQNSNKTFGQLNKFGVKVEPPKQNQYLSSLKQNDIFAKIQVGSLHDYTNISKTVNFTNLAQQLSDSIAYEEYTFVHDDSLEREQPKLALQVFKDDGIADKKKYADLKLDINSPNFELDLGGLVARSPQQPTVKEAQYHYYDAKYGIGADVKELPLCVHATGYKVFSKDRYSAFFASLQRQNYTNYHIVYIDDNSPAFEVEGLLQYLQHQQYRLKNRLTLIHTTQHLGALANMHFFMRKYCKENEVIVNIDADDALIGHQVLKVVSHVYQAEEVWFMYSRYILTVDMELKQLQIGFSTDLYPPAVEYRSQFEYWNVSHMRTFRKKLLQKVPLYMVMEYHLNQSTNMAYPAFYGFASDTFHIFSMLQMTGDYHFRHITDCLYLYYGAGSSPNSEGKDCYPKHQKFDDFKSRIKTPLQQLSSLEDEVKQRTNYAIPHDTWETFQRIHSQYEECVSS